MQNFLTGPEAAKRLSVDESRIRQLCLNKQFPNAVKRGQYWFIPISDIETYEQQRSDRGKPGRKPKQ